MKKFSYMLLFCLFSMILSGCPSAPKEEEKPVYRVRTNAQKAFFHMDAQMKSGGYAFASSYRKTESTYTTATSASNQEKISFEPLSFVQGYQMTRAICMRMRALVGLYANTVTIWREGDMVKMNGHYSEALHPDAILRVLQEVDTNGDKNISRDECLIGNKMIMEKFFK